MADDETQITQFLSKFGHTKQQRHGIPIPMTKLTYHRASLISTQML